MTGSDGSNPAEVKLVGGLIVQGKDWDLDSFGGLFQRLKKEVQQPGDPLHFVRYDGFSGDRRDVRFFGVEVPKVGQIPEGMVGLEMRGDSWTVLDHGGAAWVESLDWKWRSGVLGDFTVKCPAGWTVDSCSTLDFRISANAYCVRDGGPDDEVQLADYDPLWPERYEEMAAQLRDSLGPDLALRIEHYGSTAIPGVPAKPVIDILVEVPSFEAARRSAVPVFDRPECEYWFYSDHMVFIVRDGFMGRRTHHIHMAPSTSRIWDGLVFRDHLRTHPADAARYVALKRALAQRYTTDRERYTEAKTEFVREVLAEALSRSDS